MKRQRLTKSQVLVLARLVALGSDWFSRQGEKRALTRLEALGYVGISSASRGSPWSASATKNGRERLLS